MGGGVKGSEDGGDRARWGQVVCALLYDILAVTAMYAGVLTGQVQLGDPVKRNSLPNILTTFCSHRHLIYVTFVVTKGTSKTYKVENNQFNIQ